MLTTKTINNQNAITNAVLGTDDNSTTTINGNTTLNTLTVNGVSNFNIGAGFNAGMQIRDNTNNTFAQLFQSGPTLTIQTWTANSRIRLNTAGATAGVTTNNLLLENGNRIVIQGQDGQGIDILNNQIAINGVTTFNNSINVNNNTITLTDGTITNTLNKSDWTGTIKTVNTTANATHFLNFSDGAGTGQGNPQKMHY